MPECNGFQLRPLNPDCNRIAVKSSAQTSWCPTFKKHIFSKPEEYEVGFTTNELIVMTYQDYLSGEAAFDIVPLGDAAGTIIAQSSRNATRVLRVGTKYRYTLEPGESLIFRSANLRYPRTGNAALGF